MNHDGGAERLEQIRASLGAVLKLNERERAAVGVETTPLELVGWTSLAHIELVLELERRFDVTFEAEEIASLASVKAIVDALDRRRG